MGRRPLPARVRLTAQLLLVAVALPAGKPFAVAFIMLLVFALIGLVLAVLLPRQSAEKASVDDAATVKEPGRTLSRWPEAGPRGPHGTEHRSLRVKWHEREGEAKGRSPGRCGACRWNREVVRENLLVIRHSGRTLSR